MYQGTMIDELIEIVEKVEEHAQVVEAQARDAYDGFLYELPQSAAVMIGVA